MTGFTYFVKPCPACGRSSRIAVAYLGMDVRCKHCSRVFLANDAQSQSEAMNDPINYWINFTESNFDKTLTDGNENRNPR